MTKPPMASREPRRFRTEVEGLRAVAALLVAAYHVWFGRVSGGVDVFFVIAGFMVTTTLLGHVDRHGRIDPGRYLGRLCIRLLPNALVVLVAIAAATWWLVPSTRHDEVFAEITASALYYENWELAARSVDYLERGFTSSPAQHFWAMSIQGQFYLLWLVLFLVAARLVPRHTRGAMAVGVGALVIASFSFSVWFTGVEQPVAYFHTGARVWEFGIGGLLALSAPWWPTLSSSSRLSFGAGWAGLVAIVSCGAVLSVGTSFPGWIALWPVAGAALILLAGHHDSRLSASAVLSSRPLVALGSISYALYLWHWPLLIFVLILTERDEVGPWLGLAVIASSVALAFISTWLVERPVRSIRLDARRAWTAPVLAAVIVGPLAGGSYAVSAAAGAQIPQVATGLNPQRYPGALALEPDNVSWTAQSANNDIPAPGVTAAPEDIPAVYDEGCHARPTVDDVTWCEYGQRDAPRTMILTGGSHSAHWQPALELLAREQGWRLLSATKSGCRPGTHLVGADSDIATFNDDPDVSAQQRQSCRRWNANVTEWIGTQNPDVVVLTATATNPKGMGAGEEIPPIYPKLWGELADDDTTVLAIRDTPRPLTDVPDCLATHGARSTECDIPRSSFDPSDELDDLARDLDNVEFADLTDYLCQERTCPAVVGNIVVYSDDSHLTRSYSRSLVEPLLRVAPVLR